MSPDLENQLFAKWPKIFRDHSKFPRESCMAFGIECDDGWWTIIDTLCEALTYGYKSGRNAKELDGVDEMFLYEMPQVVADQCKEKLSSLRFYYHLEFSDEFNALAERFPNTAEDIRRELSDYIQGIVHFAEVASGRTCEITSKPGELYVRGGWYKTLCAEEAEKLGFHKPKPMD